MQVILKTLFGADATRVELLRSIGPAFAEITRTVPIESLNPFTARISDAPLIYTRRRQLKAAYKTLDLFAERILERGRRRKEHKADLLDALMQATGEDGKALSDAEIKNEILTMILAGHETTSATATWALYSLSRRPDALHRLRAEIDDGPETPAYQDLNKGYGFLDQVLQETLRLYTPAYALFRKAVDDAHVPLEDGRTMFIPKGSHVVLSTFVTHRRPRQWEATGFDAAGFFPERFDDENLQARGLKRADLLSFPFGGGPRLCLGQALSLLEARLIVIRFLQRFELEPLSTRPAKIVSDIGVKLDDGFPALIRPRR
jgi:cytochrome P450